MAPDAQTDRTTDHRHDSEPSALCQLYRLACPARLLANPVLRFVLPLESAFQQIPANHSYRQPENPVESLLFFGARDSKPHEQHDALVPGRLPDIAGWPAVGTLFAWLASTPANSRCSLDRNCGTIAPGSGTMHTEICGMTDQELPAIELAR